MSTVEARKTTVDEVVGYDRLASYLQQGSDPNARIDEFCCLIHWIALYGTDEQFEAILQAGGDVGWRAERGLTPLNFIYDRCGLQNTVNHSRVQQLVELGVEINTTDDQGHTPLHHLCRSLAERVAEVKFLHRLGANLEARETNFAGWRPLHHLANMCLPLTAYTLVELGAEVNPLTENDETPLDLVGYSQGVWHWPPERLADTRSTLRRLGGITGHEAIRCD